MANLNFQLRIFLVATAIACGTTMCKANDVSIYVDDSSRFSVLVLEGDEDANSIEIVHLFSDFHLIRGRNGTTVNGTSSVVMPFQTAVRIYTHGGDDVVDIRSMSISNNVSIRSGEGDDHVEIRDAVFSHLYVDDGQESAGDDTVLIEDVETRTIFGRVTVRAGRGRDFISVLSSEVGSIAAAADGFCTFSISHNLVRFDVEIEGAMNASSIIHFYGNDCSGLMIDTGRHRDDVNVVGNQIENYMDYSRIMTGAGSDIVWFQHNTHFAIAGFAKGLVINTGADTDQGNIRRSFVTDRIYVYQFEGSFK